MKPPQDSVEGWKAELAKLKDLLNNYEKGYIYEKKESETGETIEEPAIAKAEVQRQIAKLEKLIATAESEEKE